MPPLQFPWDSAPVPPPRPATPPVPKPRGRRPASSPAAPTAATDWRYHRLTVCGPPEPVAAFAAAARGPGVVPWRLDLDRLEEDVFVLAAAQPAAARNLTIAGCRILARQFRERVAAHQALAVARIGRSGAASRACPFDLHALLPVPAAVLRLGPRHPAALAWLAAHWGTERLRHVVAHARPAAAGWPAGHAAVGYGFFAADAAPAAAIARLAAGWPPLCFRLQPRSPV